MAGKRVDAPCIICNPAGAESGEYCEKHREELHRLDHHWETLFRLRRIARGKGHETYDLFLQEECDPRGRILAVETDPDNLTITVLIFSDVDLDARIPDFSAFGIDRTYGDQLRNRIQQEIVHSWYGNARACVDIFRTTNQRPLHWDLDARLDQTEEESSEPHSFQGGKHSIH